VSTDADEVVAVNAELYEAFETGDVDRMERVWDDADDVCCVHPGWPMLRGRSRVLRSWSVIMANTGYIQFFLTAVEASVHGDLAVVTCEENILTAVSEPDGSMSESATVVATNLFRRRDGRWRLWMHHGSPVIAPSGPHDE
jgi:uncharacterized protein (TIGR02246 family)